MSQGQGAAFPAPPVLVNQCLERMSVQMDPEEGYTFQRIFSRVVLNKIRPDRYDDSQELPFISG